jgi:hypothetical protein
VADPSPSVAPDILITIDEERVLTLRWRRLATRVSPRTAAGRVVLQVSNADKFVVERLLCVLRLPNRKGCR